MEITLAIVGIFLSVVCLIYAIHISVVYTTFNRNIKEWSKELDDATTESINRAARNILRELDRKITEYNETGDYVNNEKEKNNE